MSLFLEILNDGISPKEMNAVRGGAADPSCTCANGATYDCGCYSNYCVCNGKGSELKCSCNNGGESYNGPVVNPGGK